MHQRYDRSQRLAYRRFCFVADAAVKAGLLLPPRTSSVFDASGAAAS
jgi:hypothetical protein